LGKGWCRQLGFGVVVNRGGAIGPVGKHRLLGWVNQPPHLRPMVEAVENIFGDFGLALVWRQNFDRPVRGDRKDVGNATMFLARNSMPQKDADVGDDGASAKGAAQFCESSSNLLRLDNLVNRASIIVSAKG